MTPTELFRKATEAWGVVPVKKKVQKLNGVAIGWDLGYNGQLLDVDWDPHRINQMWEDYGHDAAVEMTMHYLQEVAHKVLEIDYKSSLATDRPSGDLS